VRTVDRLAPMLTANTWYPLQGVNHLSAFGGGQLGRSQRPGPVAVPDDELLGSGLWSPPIVEPARRGAAS
jgi:hypothetical protein